MMLIAAIGVIVFSVLGMASIAGWMPTSMLGTTSAVAVDTTAVASSAAGGTNVAPAFKCAECGVIDSVREIERRGSLDTAVFPQNKTGYATGI